MSGIKGIGVNSWLLGGTVNCDITSEAGGVSVKGVKSQKFRGILGGQEGIVLGGLPESTEGDEFDMFTSTKPSFSTWYATVPEYKNDTSGYSLEDAYDELPYSDMKAFAEGEEHLPDTYKKPSHITFSNESKFSTDDIPGGEWYYNEKEGRDYFKPSFINIRNAGSVAKLKDYFSKYEHGVKLDFSKLNLIEDKIKGN